jgi:hypothetical protein
LKKFRHSQLHCPACLKTLILLEEGTVLNAIEKNSVAVVLKTIYSCKACHVWYLSQRKKKGPGRKALPPSEKRNHAFTARLTDDEMAFIDERRGNIRVGEWMRTAALSSANKMPRPVPEVNRETALELRRIGTNINQIAHRANREGMNTAFLETAVSVLADAMMQIKGIKGVEIDALAGVDPTGDYGASDES